MKKLVINSKKSIIDFYNNNKDKIDMEFIILDSPNQSKLANYSYILSGFKQTIELKNNAVNLNGNIIEKDLFSVLRELKKEYRYKTYQKEEFFSGGLIGLMSYDYNRYIEKLPNISKDDIELPDCIFVLPEIIIIKDERTDDFYEINFTDKNIEWNLDLKSEEILIKDSDINEEDIKKFKSNIKKEAFYEIVKKAKDYIKNGDVFQVNLSQRFEIDDFDEEKSFLLYKILRKINPSPFASYVKLKDFYLISQSPERLIKKEGLNVETRPIAGTRRIKKNTILEDVKKELILNEKETAEHIMLVDLERNDIGKVCKIGTVKVNELMITENYSHVMHIVSNIRGELDKKYDEFDLIKAVFPGGTITGAPKIRTMEIIEELESTKRGFYTGSIGYINFDGDIDFNIIIRSFVAKNSKLYFQVGAGIVYDSIPEKEYKETINKGRAMILAYKNLGIRR